jgi:EAL domain-containing protein (putative c-di-GMP-specific phosphodiesterase class I)
VLALSDERIIGVEALVRWQHPRRGLLAPGEFIALAEETGLIVPLGRWVLRQACEDVASWQRTRSDESPLQLSVNLSSRQLQDPDLAADLTATLGESGLAPGSLVLELTESILMRDTASNRTLLQDLRRRGALLAIDDFGTGYSSLAYLLSFPIDVLKIDRAFVDGVTEGAEQSAVARAIIGLSDALHLTTVAEGIETVGQLGALRALGCELGQGYYFSRPLPAKDFEALLRRGIGWKPDTTAAA